MNPNRFSLITYKYLLGLCAIIIGSEIQGKGSVLTSTYISKLIGIRYILYSALLIMIFKDWNELAQRERENNDLFGGDQDSQVCSKCTKTFKNRRDKVYHERRCGNCVCSFCEKSFPHKLKLKLHINVHEEKYKCQVCNKVFTTQQGLTRHASSHDKSLEGYSCDICQQKFTLKPNLTRHMKNKHR